MKKMSEKIEELIRESIKLEINGREFFNSAAEITLNDLGKKMFLRLAQEEVKHLDAFRDLFSSVVQKAAWAKHVKEEEKSKSSVIEELASRVKRAEAKSDIEAIGIGMELEKKAIAFFSKSSQEVTDLEIRGIFDKICDEERFHYDLLQAQHDSLTNSGFWLDSAEFALDGKY